MGKTWQRQLQSGQADCRCVCACAGVRHRSRRWGVEMLATCQSKQQWQSKIKGDGQGKGNRLGKRVTEPNTARVTAKEARRKARGKALTNLQHCSHDTGFNYWTSCGWAMPGKPILATNTWCRCCAIAKHRTSKPQERIASKALPVPP